MIENDRNFTIVLIAVILVLAALLIWIVYSKPEETTAKMVDQAIGLHIPDDQIALNIALLEYLEAEDDMLGRRPLHERLGGVR